MSAVCDFYIECSERGIFPLERNVPRPAGVKLRAFTTVTRFGERMRVTGIGLADAIRWWNAHHDREVPAPAGLREFLEDFAGCLRCDECGQVGLAHYFVRSSHGETFCMDCE
jgi:hypothetical protein